MICYLFKLCFFSSNAVPAYMHAYSHVKLCTDLAAHYDVMLLHSCKVFCSCIVILHLWCFISMNYVYGAIHKS